MRNLFEQAFKELGFSLTEVMATPNFTRKVEQELMLGQHYPAHTQEGRLFRAGYWQAETELSGNLVMGTSVFRGCPTDRAYYEERVLLQILGKLLIDATLDKWDQIDPTIFKIVKKIWSKNAPTTQLVYCQILAKYIRNLFHHLSKEEQFIIDVPTTPATRIGNRFKPYRLEEAFPTYWQPGGQQPNCLGHALMLAAFMRRIGARHYLVSVVEYEIELSRGVEGQFYFLAYGDLQERKLLRNRKAHAYIKDVIKDWKDDSRFGYDFHHALVVELADGQWALIDINSMLAEILPAAWNMKAIDQNLSQYRRVLPGLCLPGNDAEELLLSLCSDNHHLLIKALGLSNALGPLLLEEPICWTDLRIVLYMYDVPAFLTKLRILRGLPSLDNEEMIEQALFGWEKSKTTFERSEIRYARFNADPVYRKRCIKWLLSRFHAWTISIFNGRKEKILKKAVHPALEFHADTRHALALSVLSAIHCAISKGPLTPQILRHGSCQTLWSDTTDVNSHVCRPDYDLDLSLANEALRSVSQRSQLHTRIRNKLEVLGG